MKVAIVLGNRLNDDGSLSIKGLKRCQILINALNIFEFEKVIISGGINNELTNISEARAMYDYLIIQGIDKNLLMLEEESTSTTENAYNSLNIVKELGINEVVVISSIEHFGRSEPKNAIVCFREVIKEFKGIKLSMYTEEY